MPVLRRSVEVVATSAVGEQKIEYHEIEGALLQVTPGVADSACSGYLRKRADDV